MTTEGKCTNGLYKRGGSWYIRVKINGVRHRKSFGTDRDAAKLALAEIKREQALARVRNDYAGLDALLSPKCTKTFREAAAEYIAERSATLKPSSKLAYEDRLNQLLDDFGDIPLSEITESHIAVFRNKLVAAGRSAARVNAVLNLLRFVLKVETRRGSIQANPALGVDALAEGDDDIDPLTREELALVLAHLKPEHKPIFTCLAWTGARPGELIALRWSDVDFVRNEIRIDKASYKGIESTPKTKSSIRTIKMLPPVRAVLEHLRDSKNVLDFPCATSATLATSYVFPVNREKIKLDRVWATALSKAGVRHRRSYQLRHTFASLLLEAGETPGWIASQLGHKSPAITLRHYARWFKTGREVEQRVSEALFGSTPILGDQGPQNGPQPADSAQRLRSV